MTRSIELVTSALIPAVELLGKQYQKEKHNQDTHPPTISIEKDGTMGIIKFTVMTPDEDYELDITVDLELCYVTDPKADDELIVYSQVVFRDGDKIISLLNNNSCNIFELETVKPFVFFNAWVSTLYSIEELSEFVTLITSVKIFELAACFYGGDIKTTLGEMNA